MDQNSDQPRTEASSTTPSLAQEPERNEVASAGHKRWKPKKCDRDLFPDRPDGNRLPLTIANLKYLLDQNGISVRYNVISKKGEISIPAMQSTPDNGDNVSLAYVYSLATLNGLSTGHVDSFLGALADMNAYNPVADWIRSRGWDGTDRLPAFYDTITAADDFPDELKQPLMRKWLLSCVAAALMKSGFRCRGVLVLQGPQGIGKTTWGQGLISDLVLADTVIKTDHHLDGGNKDSLISAITHFIVEIGELESSFKRDISRLKGFLTADSDKVRRPYGKVDSEYPRRTVFYATVNQSDFLVDTTGNSRWWTIPVVEIDYEHKIDMQQLFAQLAVDFENGAQWWLSAEEESDLASRNERHNSFSLVRDKLSGTVNFEAEPTEEDRYLTASDLLAMAGLERPTNAQAKECGALLRAAFGEPKRVQDRDRWRVPIREDVEDEDISDAPHTARKIRQNKDFD